MEPNDLTAVWPFFYAIEKAEKGPRTLELNAEPEVLARIAAIGELIALDKLEAQLEVAPHKNGREFTVKGKWQADVVYQSVRTLEPVPRRLSGKVKERLYIDFSAENANGDAKARDEIEPLFEITETGLPLGDMIAELLVIELDPYPYGDDEAPVNYVEDEEDEASDNTHRPFMIMGNPKQESGSE